MRDLADLIIDILIHFLQYSVMLVNNMFAAVVLHYTHLYIKHNFAICITAYENCSIINIATGTLDTICFSILHINYIVFMIYMVMILTVFKSGCKNMKKIYLIRHGK